MFRSISFWVGVILATIAVLLLLLLCLPFKRKGRTAHFIAQQWGKLNLLTSGVNLQVSGLENIIKDKPQIFMSNHQSIYDIFVLNTLPLPFKWLAKKELFKVPILGWAMVLIGCISVDRFDSRKALASISSLQGEMQKGSSIVIFPEGTRSKDGTVQPFKKGGFILALKTKAPIIPVTIIGSANVMRKGTMKVCPGTIKLIIGKPIETVNLRIRDRRKLTETVQGLISKNLSENGYPS